MVRTSEPQDVTDNWNVGQDRRGPYIQREFHYEKQRGTIDTIFGWILIIGTGGAALWCWTHGADLALRGSPSKQPVKNKDGNRNVALPPTGNNVELAKYLSGEDKNDDNRDYDAELEAEFEAELIAEEEEFDKWLGLDDENDFDDDDDDE
jgi:hypothetical protein